MTVDVYERAADAAMRGHRRRADRGRVLPGRETTAPDTGRTLDVTDEWLRRAHGLVATVDLPWVVIHHQDRDRLYVVHRRDEARKRSLLRRVDRCDRCDP